MAAPGSRTLTSDSDSSSSDNEQRERLKEAAWLPPGVKESVQQQQHPVVPIIPSLRTQPDHHEHDGNELQTTPEFRAHVAKKLTAMLDSCIKEMPGSSSNVTEEKLDVEDEGFRLFSTSVPGDTGTMKCSLLPKRRPAYSSSSEDSEEENQRCREAAVSGLDILKCSALAPVSVEASHTPSYDHITKKHKKKKKKKKDVGDGPEPEQQEIMQDHVSNGYKKNMNKHLGHENDSHHKDLQEEQKATSLKKKKKKRHKSLHEDTELEHQNLQKEPCGIEKKRKKKAQTYG